MILPGGIDTDAQLNDSLLATTRYASAVWADGSNTRSMTSSYRLTFSVNATAGLEYEIAISHDLEGVLQTESPGLLNACIGCSASVSNVTATVVGAGGGVVSGNLVQLVGQTIGGDDEVNLTAAPAVFTISGLSGDQTFTIDFTWLATATAGVGDDAAGRFGLQPNGGSLYDQPGTFGPGDGHFLSIAPRVTAVPVPEPSTAALLALGLAFLASASRRRA